MPDSFYPHLLLGILCRYHRLLSWALHVPSLFQKYSFQLPSLDWLLIPRPYPQETPPTPRIWMRCPLRYSQGTCSETSTTCSCHCLVTSITWQYAHLVRAHLGFVSVTTVWGIELVCPINICWLKRCAENRIGSLINSVRGSVSDALWVLILRVRQTLWDCSLSGSAGLSGCCKLAYAENNMEFLKSLVVNSKS